MCSFFLIFVEKKELSLVEFYIKFESALTQQRQSELHSNHVNDYEPDLKMKLKLEKFMSENYTYKLQNTSR